MRRKLAAFIARFIALEASSGVVLFIFAVLAMAWANVAPSAYGRFWHHHLGDLSLSHWVNDGLMAAFFLVVGLEIKHEAVAGAFRTWRAASLPVYAALGGMVVPVALYLIVYGGLPSARGWGVPMATDIAFALGVLALLGRRVPSGLRLLLMALAIVDDLGAVLVIAFFYTTSVHGWLLAAGFALWGLMLLLSRVGVRSLIPYAVLAVGMWACILPSGVHATIAGVLAAFAFPKASLESVIERLHPWVAYGVMPLFALANAGVPISLPLMVKEAGSPIGCGILLGLVVGKPFGIGLASWLAVRFGGCHLPAGVRFRHILVMGCLGGIGFTMALFINDLAFRAPAGAATGKLAIVMASVVSASLGVALSFPKSHPAHSEGDGL